ncbi:MAG TPA: hypothetical protein VL308_01235 [Gemmatimonadaceae bacterium]|nr:hypothetical protein [Gemmatimonadaceae bacterium]
MHSLGRAALAAMMIVGAGTAKGQITTFVASPPRKTEPAQQAAAQQREKVAQDSVARVAMTGMKEWVDSASAALAIRPDTVPNAADTAVGTPRVATAPAPKSDSSANARASERQSEFRNGARAPNTATPIPMIALAGVLLIVMGMGLRRRERSASVRVQR